MPFARSRSYISSSGSIDCGSAGIVRPRVAELRRPGRARSRSSARRASIVSSSLPVERRRHLRARAGPDAPRAEDRLVRRVLVEVDEDALAALLLPPRVGDACRGGGARARARPRPRRRAPGTDPSGAAAARRRGCRGCRWSSGAPAMPSSSNSALHVGGRGARLVEAGAGLRIEVDAQLVGVLGVVGERRPDVEAETAEVHGPGDVREIGGDERPRRRAVRRADDRRLEPRRARCRAPASGRTTSRSAPCGNRCMSTGRPPIVRMIGSATAR